MTTKKYRLIITPTAFKEMEQIYDYIFENLKAEWSAIDLMRQVETEVQKLKEFPEMYAEIEKNDKLKRKYRKISIKNYVILYTIDKENKVVFISHMYYQKQNYID